MSPTTIFKARRPMSTSVVKADSRVGTPSFYQSRLALSRDWLIASIAPSGGSRAYFAPLLGWSKAYPETSGYIIPTLLAIAERNSDVTAKATAMQIADWLVAIQSPEGYWRSGLYPYSPDARPSVFNTAQILIGLTSLSGVDGENGDIRRDAARRAAHWLASGVDAHGVWRTGHYRDHQPAYYSYVVWPMIEFSELFGSEPVREAAVRALRNLRSMRRPNGTFDAWGFELGRPAFTHTIAYTIQGLLECARITRDASLIGLVDDAIEKLRRAAELNNGKLPGAYDSDWRPDRSFECLTGSAQTAICLLLRHKLDPDLRYVNAAAKLVDRLCELQSQGPGRSLSGALAGSRPLWGPYMQLRYPNWAVKFHADALMALLDTLESEGDD
jgi:hypothetical protein